MKTIRRLGLVMMLLGVYLLAFGIATAVQSIAIAHPEGFDEEREVIEQERFNAAHPILCGTNLNPCPPRRQH